MADLTILTKTASIQVRGRGVSYSNVQTAQIKFNAPRAIVVAKDREVIQDTPARISFYASSSRVTKPQTPRIPEGDIYYPHLYYGTSFNLFPLFYNYSTGELEQASLFTPGTASETDEFLYPNNMRYHPRDGGSENNITDVGWLTGRAQTEDSYHGAYSLFGSNANIVRHTTANALGISSGGMAATYQFAYKFSGVPPQGEKVSMLGQWDQTTSTAVLEFHVTNDDPYEFRFIIRYNTPIFNASGDITGYTEIAGATSNTFRISPKSWNLYRFTINPSTDTAKLFVNDELVASAAMTTPTSVSFFYPPRGGVGGGDPQNSYIMGSSNSIDDRLINSPSGWLDAYKLYLGVAIEEEKDTGCGATGVLPIGYAERHSTATRNTVYQIFNGNGWPVPDGQTYPYGGGW